VLLLGDGTLLRRASSLIRDEFLQASPHPVYGLPRYRHFFTVARQLYPLTTKHKSRLFRDGYRDGPMKDAADAEISAAIAFSLHPTLTMVTMYHAA
jgi:hypothetical protein